MEITQERLGREYNLSLISTAPTVVYHVTTKSGEELRIDNPAELPPTQDIAAINEPRIITSIHVPEEYVGAVMKLWRSVGPTDGPHLWGVRPGHGSVQHTAV